MAEANAISPTAEPEQDQSMEEILQSIRRIIAEEGDDVQEEGAEPVPQKQMSPMGSDVLELTDLVKEDGSIVNIQDEKEALKQEALAPVVPPAVKPEIIAEPKMPEAKAPEEKIDILSNIDRALTPAAESIISEQAASASVAALRSIPTTPVKEPVKTTPSPAFRSGLTVEDLVLEALRPMLKEWLDGNLPRVVERVVEREVRKLTSTLE